MKKQINEIKKMQHLAGLITESEYQESLVNEAASVLLDKAYKAVKDLVTSKLPNNAAYRIALDDRLEYTPSNINDEKEKNHIIDLITKIGLNFDGIEKGALLFSDPSISSSPSKLDSDATEGDGLPITPKIQKFIDKVVNKTKTDGQFNTLVKSGYFDNELIDFILEKFDLNFDYDHVSDEIKDYIDKVTK